MKQLTLLKDYINKCALIFTEKRSTPSKLVPLQKDFEITHKTARRFLNHAIIEAESTTEFSKLIDFFKDYPLFKDADIKAIKIAINAFFKNTGTYESIWNNEDIKEDSLIEIIETSKLKNDFDVIHLFVFDGFQLHDTEADRNLLRQIKLPYGNLLILRRDELNPIFGIPQSEWPGTLTIDYLSNLHILIVKDKEKYRKPTAEDLGQIHIPASFDLFGEWRERIKRESNIDYFGPLFLCLGEDANLAQEIIIRTCIFDKRPISILNRNDFILEPIMLDDEVDFFPRRSHVYIGKDGIMLTNLYKMWDYVNNLNDKNDYLRFSTEAYVRAILNWHYQPDSTMELFVSFITVIDSLLTRGERRDLAYKVATRGAAILSHDSEKRIKTMSYLKKLYTIRSEIVHEGHSKGTDFINYLAFLPIIVRYIFIKFIAVAYLFKNNLIEDKLLLNNKKPKSIKNSIPYILDLLVMKPELSHIIDNKLSEMNIEFKKDISSYI